MNLYTEKETEEWLVREAKEIILPSGYNISTSQFHITWAVLDNLVSQYDIPESWFFELAYDNAKDLKLDFDLSLHNIVCRAEVLFLEKFMG